MRRYILAASIAVMLMLSIPLCSYAGGYVTHVLSSPVSSYSWAYDINDSGQVVGTVACYDPYDVSAVLWNDFNANPQSLDEESKSSNALLINNSGTVIGKHESPPGSMMPFKWTASSGVTNIDVSFNPEAVNGSGTMVGWATAPDIQQVPVVVSSTGGVTYLDYTCGNGGIARDINDSGYIAGDSYAPVWGGHACLWYGEDVVDLGAFGGTWSSALEINNSGQVVGVYGGDEGAIGNLIWSSSTETIFIPACSLLDSGSFGPVDINNNGVVLGNAEMNGVDTVVTWSLTGGFTVVGTGIAYAINNSGWIVGISDLNDSQAVVWEPVPEPSAFVALACGLVGILTRTRKRPNL